MKSLVLLPSILLGLCAAWSPAAAALPGSSAQVVDDAAMVAFGAANRKPGKVIAHLDLTRPFDARTSWAFVAVQGPAEQNPYDADKYTAPGEIALCLMHGTAPDCTGPKFPTSLPDTLITWDKAIENHRELNATIVHGGTRARLPLLLLATRSLPSGDGDELLSTFVLAYDENADRFTGWFANATGKNNNQATRFIDRGPLSGAIVAEEQAAKPPFGYDVALYRSPGDAPYKLVFQYRSKTLYGDGNPLAVIDSEMPEILRRLHLWKAGDRLPIPLVMPADCHRLELRHGVEWCN
jgi:hypothetical protein